MIRTLLTIDLLLAVVFAYYSVKTSCYYPDQRDVDRGAYSMLAFLACVVVTLLALIWS